MCAFNVVMKSLAALALVVAPAFCAVKAGDPAPDIVLKALLPNQPVAAATLDALKGKAIVLEFWATWCAPCVGSIPHLNKLADQFQNRAIQFLSVTGEEAPAVEKFLKARAIHGWVGLDDADRTYKPYGFEGIPQTVLIDAAGKVAGIASPEILTAAHVEDLLAGRLPNLPPPPERPDLSISRSGSDTGPRPLLDIVVRPSTAKDGAMKAGKGILQFRWFTLRDLLSYAYRVPPERILGEAADDGMRYDLSLAAPGLPGDDLVSLLPQLLCAAFHVTVKRESRPTAAWVLTTPHGKPDLLVEAASPGEMSQTENGELKVIGMPMEDFAEAVQDLVSKPVVDETHLPGRFDVSLKYDPTHPESVFETLRAHGFDIQQESRPIEFLIVNKK